MKREKTTAVSLKPGSFAYVWSKISKDPGAMIGLAVIVLMFVMSFLSPHILKYSMSEMNLAVRYQPPSLEHPFGCDDLGRDILARVLYGARYTLSIGILSVAISSFFGILLGAVAGYFSGWVDGVIMRVLDVFQAFPQLLLAVTFASVFGPGLDKAILALGISGIPNYARLMRANILTIRSNEFIEAAISTNCSKVRIITRHVIPNAISPMIVQMSMGIANAGISAACLSFLGLGIQPPAPEWGAMLSVSRQFMQDHPHMVMIPGLFIMISVICFNLIGDAIRDALDPKLKD